MKIEIDGSKLEEIFKRLQKPAEVRKTVAGAYGGLDLSNKSTSNFEELTFKYKEKKEKKGFSPEIWERTGKSKQALKNFSLITGEKNTERRDGLVFVFKRKKSYIELDTMHKNKRKAKDAFYATNYKRPLVKWNDALISQAMDDLVEKYEKQMKNIIREIY